MTNFKIFLFIFLHFIVTYAKISDLRRCANTDCSEPISLAKTVIKYYSDDSRILSFPSNVDVKIFSKEAGTRLDLWGAEIFGKRGYVPKANVRETKILKVNLDFLIPTEGQDDPAIKSDSTISTEKPIDEKTPLQDQISPQAVTPPYEVIDGTTLYLGPDANSSPEYSSTPSSIDSSEVEQSAEVSKTETDSLDQKPPTPASETEEATNENIIAESDIQDKENNEAANITETNSLDEKPVYILTPASDSKEEVKENIIAKEDAEGEENEDDEDTEDENDTEEKEEDNNVDEDLETSTEAQYNSEMPIISEKASIETIANISELSSTEEIKDVSVNNSASVISSPESVEEKTDLPDLNSITTEPPQVEPVVVESKPDEPPPISVTLKSDNPIIVEIETDDFTPVFVDLKPDEVKEIKENNMELNSLPNPLNLFQPLNEIKDESDVSPNQVPEINENEPSPSFIAEDIPTTQASVDDIILPNIDILETFTENPGSMNNPTEKSNIIEDKNEEVERLIADIKQIDSSEMNLSNMNLIEDHIEMDQSEKPVFIDTVTDKFNPLDLEEIPQPNNFDEDIENVSDSYEEISENLVNEHGTEQTSADEEASELVDGMQEPSIFSKMYNSIFGSRDNQDVPVEEIINDVQNNKLTEENSEEAKIIDRYNTLWGDHVNEKPADKYLPIEDQQISNNPSDMQSCAASDNPTLCRIQHQNDINNENMIEEVSWSFEVPENAYNIFLYLSLTAVTVLLFSLGFYYIEKKRKDGSLIECINNLEKKLLISSKECLLLQDELKTTKERLISIEDSSFGSNEMVTSLKEELEEARGTRIELEEQVTNLEKELENATEAGMELNRMLREILTSQSGNVHLMQNVEHLQKQLNEQQETINSMKAILSVKNTENELLQTELAVANEKNNQLQEELDKMVVNLLSVQEEKNNIENKLEDQNEKLKSEYEINIKQINTELNVLKQDNKNLKKKLEETERVIDLKNIEYDYLKDGMNEMLAAQSNKDSIMALLDVSQVKAEVQQLRDEKHKMAEKLQKGIEEKSVFEKEVQVMIQEVKILKDKFDEAEKEKVEAQTRLEVLSTYFKDKEAQLQKEINENETKFMQKEGEATSTIERIKWIQAELQNYKSQNELLKKEILDQEVSLKSQISMLENKSYDNWVLARQAERKLEESKKEASQLRNRLTIVEKNHNNSSQMGDESKLSYRMSPLESNGELPVSPLHMNQLEAPGSPPLLFPHRDFMTTSPPLSRLPPFLPPPSGVVPPPSGVVPPPLMPLPMPGCPPPFMLTHPAQLPRDHRLPPLGRMSSPPLNRHYSHDRAYSPYDRDDSPPLSPSYEDSDCRRRSPSPGQNYSPYGKKQFRQWDRDEDRDRDYRGTQQRNKSRMHKGMSSGSGNSNESLDNSGRRSGRV